MVICSNPQHDVSLILPPIGVVVRKVVRHWYLRPCTLSTLLLSWKLNFSRNALPVCPEISLPISLTPLRKNLPGKSLSSTAASHSLSTEIVPPFSLQNVFFHSLISSCHIKNLSIWILLPSPVAKSLSAWILSSPREFPPLSSCGNFLPSQLQKSLSRLSFRPDQPNPHPHPQPH